MRHHLRKAREIYRSGGVFETARSALRYVPIECNNLVFRARHGTGTRVMAEDWDTLVVLDACRYDMFADTVTLAGDLESRISLGSSSEEFLERNFGDGAFHDTVYVNANPYVPRLELDRDGTFHAVVDCLADWDADLQTVRPETVADAARAAHGRFPDKRLIVHFMQPHTPFIGPVGRELAGGGWTMDLPVEDRPGIWQHLRDGADIDLETVWRAYVENLEVALEAVGPLLEDLDGKTVLTADHGNLVGERLWPIPSRRKFGHPYGVHTETLLRVPWFVVPWDHRRPISRDPPVDQDRPEAETVEDRLAALGYR